MDTDQSKFHTLLNAARSFFASDAFGWILVLFATLIVLFNWYVKGAFLFALLACVIIIVCPDIVCSFLPILMLASFAIQAKNSYDDFIVFWPVGFLIAFSVGFHFVKYKKLHRPEKGYLFSPILLVSIVCLLGGVGTITAAEYFRFLSLAYMIGLGFFVLILYVIMKSLVYPGANGDRPMDERIAKLFCFLLLFLCISVLEYYVEHWSEFMRNPGILAFQWRNNACTLIMVGLPFTFYMARKHIWYFGLSLACALTLVLTGSRGGLLMGLIEFAACLIYFAVKDKKHRPVYLAVTGVAILGFLLLLPTLMDFLSYTLGRFTDSGENAIRLGLWKRGWQDFCTSPLNGRGLGYMGNRDIHPSSIATLCWYHCAPIQVIGSFGLMGVATYGYQMAKRLKLLWGRKTTFSRTVLLSLFGVELMSLVNPGMFVPLFLITMTMLFVVVENYEINY